MLHKFYPSAADYDNLSRVGTVSETAPLAEFTGVVVNKPWGYEYLWYETPTVAIWMLFLKPGAATSLHCHVKKRTSLIVLEGEIRCTTLEDVVRLQPLDSVVLEPCVFHSSESTAPTGAFLMEIETPPMKHDLVRLRDRYKRAGTAYEGQTEYSQETGQYAYSPLQVAAGAASQQFRSVRFQLRGVADRNTALLLASEHDILIPLSHGVSGLERCKLEVGEAAAVHHVPAELFPPHFDPVEILFCKVTTETPGLPDAALH